MNLDTVVYSTKPLNLRDHIFLQRFSSANDYQAMLDIILVRTNIRLEDALELDDEDLGIVMGKITESVMQAIQLTGLSKGIDV